MTGCHFNVRFRTSISLFHVMHLFALDVNLWESGGFQSRGIKSGWWLNGD